MTNHTDLHMHTTASDGDYPPDVLVKMAHDRALTTIAITDHDTTDGITPAQEAAAPLNIEVIPAIELSAETAEHGDVHMLGYFIDITNAVFQARLQTFRENRYHRARAMLKKLNALGIPLKWAQIEAAADGAPITRPHVARALQRAGYVDSLKEAFDKYISQGAPAYVARTRMTPEEAVELVHSAGGVAVVAHPGLIKQHEPVLQRLIPVGLDGVEVNHPKNPPEVVENVTVIAQQHGLIMTGGSDFHRPERSDGSILLGTVNPPDDAVMRLRERAKNRHQI